MTANLVLQFPQEQKNIQQRYPSIACYYEGNEFTVSRDFQEVLSARYYWHDVPNKRLADMAHRSESALPPDAFQACANWTTCDPGQFVSANGTTTADRTCLGCADGRYSTSENAQNCANWTTCLPGQFVAVNGTTTADRTCQNCADGRYSTSDNTLSCTNWTTCVPGQSIATSGSSSTNRICQGCAHGSFTTGENAESCANWTACLPGQFVAANGTTIADRTCPNCADGRYSTSHNAQTCKRWTICAPGQFIATPGSSSTNQACSVCPAGKYSVGSNVQDCDRCPPGSYCNNGVKTPCPPGRYGTPRDAERASEAVCIACPVSTYGARAGEQNVTACLDCPAGRYGLQVGLSNTTGKVADFCPEACPAGQYLDQKRCRLCAAGASCPGGTDATGMTAKTGYWRVPNTTVFAPCLYPCSWLGANNPDLRHSCPNEAFIDHAERCNVQKGYRAGSRLCADCQPGYSRDGRGQCKKCSEKGLQIVFPALAAIGIVCCLCLLIWLTVIKRGGSFQTSDGAKKIFISYLQLAALATSMDIPWPGNCISLFRVQALVSSVGEAFIDVRCAMEEPVSIAQVEYGKALAYALLPFALVLLSALVWQTCGRRYVDSTHVNPMMTGTIVLLLYLVYPSISASVLGLWKCEEVDRVGTIFVVDPETLCTDLSHREWTHGVGVPSILVYVLGLPAMAMGVMYKFRHKLDEQHTRVRFGLLYDGFKRENYLHECWWSHGRCWSL